MELEGGRLSMLEVLQFIFSSFWIWLGFMLLIGATTGGVNRVFKSLVDAAAEINSRRKLGR